MSNFTIIDLIVADDDMHLLRDKETREEYELSREKARQSIRKLSQAEIDGLSANAKALYKKIISCEV